jgi:hypothetical protein
MDGPVLHAGTLLATHGRPAALRPAVRALATAAAAAASAGGEDDPDGESDDGVGTLASSDGWGAQAVHLAMATAEVLPSLAPRPLYRAALWTLLRHGAGPSRHGVSAALALAVATLAATGDVWEVRQPQAYGYVHAPHTRTRRLTRTDMREQGIAAVDGAATGVCGAEDGGTRACTADDGPARVECPRGGG